VRGKTWDQSHGTTRSTRSEVIFTACAALVAKNRLHLLWRAIWVLGTCIHVYYACWMCLRGAPWSSSPEMRQRHRETAVLEKSPPARAHDPGFTFPTTAWGFCSLPMLPVGIASAWKDMGPITRHNTFNAKWSHLHSMCSACSQEPTPPALARHMSTWHLHTRVLCMLNVSKRRAMV